MKILITGIPGTGKTTIGEYLRSQYNYQHLNFEDPSNVHFYISETVADILKAYPQEDLVITWGFRPFEDSQYVLNLKYAGFKLIWFDGNRPAARKAFLERGTVSENALNIQMHNINSANIIENIDPIKYDTFDKNGEFKEIKIIAKDIIKII